MCHAKQYPMICSTDGTSGTSGTCGTYSWEHRVLVVLREHLWEHWEQRELQEHVLLALSILRRTCETTSVALITDDDVRLHLLGITKNPNISVGVLVN
jgi:hypothetical protein